MAGLLSPLAGEPGSVDLALNPTYGVPGCLTVSHQPQHSLPICSRDHRCTFVLQPGRELRSTCTVSWKPQGPILPVLRRGSTGEEVARRTLQSIGSGGGCQSRSGAVDPVGLVEE
jgi:hypothetical protein